MISPKIFLELLNKNGVDFFTGVPDSLLKDFCLYVEENIPKKNHIITANEGAAIGLAAGHHLATGNIAMVYMQNSGLGNAMNPLTSLVDCDVYSIPVLMLIGWRGEPGVQDEPQHKKMGKITTSILDSMGIPYFILSESSEESESLILNAIKLSKEKEYPVAIIVKKNIFSEYKKIKEEAGNKFKMSREKALEIIVKKSDLNCAIVSTTGKLSRELFEIRKKNNQQQQDFLTVGSMGHASQIALGVSLETNKKVICLDGDGAIIMHMGSLAINGMYAPNNYLHIVLNNGCHESVGGQPTQGFNINIYKIAEICGYKNVKLVDDENNLSEVLEKFLLVEGPSFIEVRINKDSRSNLGRPTKTPIENKNSFVNFLKK